MMKDLLYSIRTLRRNPGFTAVAVVTLALGIGANTAIFSVVNGILLSPLPYPNEERVAVLSNFWEDGRIGLSEQEYLAYKDQTQVFDAVAAYQFSTLNITGGDRAEQVIAGAIGVDVLPLLGVPPMIGRNFVAEEDVSGGPATALLGYGLWQRRYAGDRGIIGQTIVLDGIATTVVGVLPPDLKLPGDFVGTPVQIYVPLALDPVPDSRNIHYLRGLARLHEHVTIDEGRAVLASVAEQLKRELGTLPASFSTTLIPVREEVVGAIRPALLVLLAAVGLVLLIASVNVANLMLARADVRQRELAVRQALGARRNDILRLLLAEVSLLAATGGVLGLVLAHWAIKALVALSPAGLPRANGIAIDGRVLAFAALTALATGVLFGLLPALKTSQFAGQADLHGGTRGGTGGVARKRARRTLLIAEVALASALAIGAGLMVKSFLQLRSVHPGFEKEGVLTMQLTLPESKYDNAVSARNFYGSLLESIRSIGGVVAAGGIRNLPLASGAGDWGIRIRGTGPDGLGERGPKADWHVATDGYFEAMRIPLTAGRYLQSTDRSGTLNAVVINQTMARQYWPDGSALGAQFRMTTDIDTIWRTVVGVVGDVRQRGLDDEIRTAMYLPHAQFPSTANFPVGSLTLVVRTAMNPTSVAAAVVDEVGALDPEVPVSRVRTMEQVVRSASADQRFQGVLFTLFASMALALVAVGIYGVTSYLVSQRTRELGIRVALGAAPRNVIGLVLGEGMALTLIGVALGVAGALALTRYLSSLLYGVQTHDVQTFVFVPLIVVVAAVLASYVPALRATRVDPIEVLRHE